LKIPIAHGEGRYYADEKTLDSLESNGQVLYRYCNEVSKITVEANPNGSLRNIAGISNHEGNIIGMMPHPERATNEALGNSDGLLILKELFLSERKESRISRSALV
jgi:phosphoribosylformylglycinamidine synthase